MSTWFCVRFWYQLPEALPQMGRLWVKYSDIDGWEGDSVSVRLCHSENRASKRSKKDLVFSLDTFSCKPTAKSKQAQELYLRENVLERLMILKLKWEGYNDKSYPVPQARIWWNTNGVRKERVQ